MKNQQAGQGIVEYALWVAVMGALLYGVMSLFGNSIVAFFMRGQ
jgi:hypothetical protein